jgi:hypothetical protein
MNMLRALGGCVGLAISTSMLSTTLSSDLPTLLSPADVAHVRASLNEAQHSLSAAQLDTVRGVYGEGYNRGFRVMCAFAGGNVLVTAGLGWVWRRRGGVQKMMEVVAAARGAGGERDWGDGGDEQIASGGMGDVESASAAGGGGSSSSESEGGMTGRSTDEVK